MMKIESQAMKAFQTDVSQNPELAKEFNKNNPLFKKLAKTESTAIVGSRFGDESSQEESTVLVRGRERALETIAKKFEKKSKWLEGKTAEGKTYYWNKETMGLLYSLFAHTFNSTHPLTNDNLFQRPNGIHQKVDFFRSMNRNITPIWAQIAVLSLLVIDTTHTANGKQSITERLTKKCLTFNFLDNYCLKLWLQSSQKRSKKRKLNSKRKQLIQLKTL